MPDNTSGRARRPTLIEVVDPNASIEFGQRCRESAEVLGVSTRRHIHVVGRLERRALRDRSERPDHDVVDLMAIQGTQNVLG